MKKPHCGYNSTSWGRLCAVVALFSHNDSLCLLLKSIFERPLVIYPFSSIKIKF